jgi:hypothetical protein
MELPHQRMTGDAPSGNHEFGHGLSRISNMGVRPMYGPVRFLKDAYQIAVDSQHVIAMRLAKIFTGSPGAVAESRRMVSEKVAAVSIGQKDATTTLVSGKGIGAATQAAIEPIKRTVRANRRRLTVSRWIDGGVNRLRKLFGY